MQRLPGHDITALGQRNTNGLAVKRAWSLSRGGGQSTPPASLWCVKPSVRLPEPVELLNVRRRRDEHSSLPVDHHRRAVGVPVPVG